ncbi:hypothetical protein FALBO_16704, partial [Fusarium albosuccineum]
MRLQFASISMNAAQVQLEIADRCHMRRAVVGALFAAGKESVNCGMAQLEDSLFVTDETWIDYKTAPSENVGRLYGGGSAGMKRAAEPCDITDPPPAKKLMTLPRRDLGSAAREVRSAPPVPPMPQDITSSPEDPGQADQPRYATSSPENLSQADQPQRDEQVPTQPNDWDLSFEDRMWLYNQVNEYRSFPEYMKRLGDLSREGEHMLSYALHDSRRMDHRLRALCYIQGENEYLYIRLVQSFSIVEEKARHDKLHRYFPSMFTKFQQGSDIMRDTTQTKGCQAAEVVCERCKQPFFEWDDPQHHVSDPKTDIVDV